MRPLISAVVPMYNIGSRVSYMLTSLMNQDYSNLEAIFVDDGCSDDTVSIVSSMIADNHLDNFKIISHQKNGGVAAARNTGMAAANGDYIIFLDGDDMADANLLSSLYERIEREGADCDFAACGYKDLLDGKTVDHPAASNNGLEKEELLKLRLLNKADLSIVTFLFKRDFLQKNDLKFFASCEAGEDEEFIIKALCRAKHFAFADGCPYTYVHHEDMGSRKYVKKKEDYVRRYSSQTGAILREAEYIDHYTKSQTLHVLAENMLLPMGCQRKLAVCAMNDEKEKFFDMLNSKETRKILLNSHKSFQYKPEVFLKSLALMCFPNLYYDKYSKKFS